jgi:NSS family neurotransmitter:Na+ symporter
MAGTIFIVARGVRRGIERTAMLLMPVLFVLVCGLAIYAFTLPGSGAGYRYYLDVDFDELFSAHVLTQAAGQAFFSLSLGMGAMLTFASYLDRGHHLPNESVVIAGSLTFASYLDRGHHLPNESVVIAGSDIGIAFIAGLVVFPLIYALGLSGAVGESTVGALFITLPQAFAEMGGVGRFVGLLFFAALVVGALTSALSLLEVVVSAAIDGLGWTRTKASVWMGGAIAVLGIPAAWNTDVLGVMDGIANNLLLLSGGLLLAIFVGWFMRDPLSEVRQGAEGVRWFFLWRTLLRFVAPLFLLYVLLDAVPGTLQSIAALFGN